jgi:5-methylcytosine-specific restriction endonuclease McrA
MKSKRTKATEIPMEVKDRVFERDGGRCIICNRAGMPNAHYIRRSQGGLGIEQNIVTLCLVCHHSYDNGYGRESIGKKIHDYLEYKYYQNWNEEDLIYNKWKDKRI